MVRTILGAIKRRGHAYLQRMHRWLLQQTKPTTATLARGAIADAAKSKAALMAENALLRQQVIVLQRQVARPAFTPGDRVLLVLLARLVQGWRAALLIIQPDTLLRWHRQGYRLVWRVRSATATKRPQVSEQTVALIKRMAAENRLWGAERIRGELLKLGVRVGKRTVQRHMRGVRPPHPSRQTWATFLHNHAHDVWACDFLPVIDLGFRALFAFFIVDLGSRRVVPVGVTRHPTDAWGAQQLRACLDHLLILHENQLRRVLRAYCASFNTARPHQGISQAIPNVVDQTRAPHAPAASIMSIPVLGGLHHDYQRAA